MKTQTQTQTDDQALINDLFSEFDLDLDAAETAVEPEQEVMLAAEPTAEVAIDAELDLDIDLDLEVELAAAEPAAESVEVEAPPAVAVAAVLPPCDEDMEFDFEFDQAEQAEVEAEVAAFETKEEKEEKAPKAVKPKASSGGNRVTYYNSSKSTVLLDRLGGNKELIILEASDLELSKEELQSKRQYLLDVMNHQPMTMNEKGDPTKSDGLNGQTVQKKVAEKVIQLFTYMGKGGNLNKVMRLAFQTLLTEGYLSFGKQGNLYDVLLANEFSVGTARAQTGQIKQLFPLLKIVTVEGDMMKQNPESIILAKMNADLYPEQAA